MPPFSLAYRSRSLIGHGATDILDELTKLVEVARSRNKQLNVTGALIFSEGLFAQILEGEESAVREIFQSIQCDRRHTDIYVLPNEPYEERRFQTWSMAFVGPTPRARAYYDRFSIEKGFEWT